MYREANVSRECTRRRGVEFEVGDSLFVVDPMRRLRRPRRGDIEQRTSRRIFHSADLKLRVSRPIHIFMSANRPGEAPQHHFERSFGGLHLDFRENDPIWVSLTHR